MKKLRLGVIGAGSWTVVSHLPNLARRRDEVEFVGVARKGKEMLARIKDDWGFKVASEDYRDVIDAGMDICVVASPHRFHYEHTKAALEAGAHVLCEKPFTVEPAHAWELTRIADERGLHLVVSYGYNYLPWTRRTKRLVEEHGIGEVEEIAMDMTSVTRGLLANLASYPSAAPDAIPEAGTWTDPRNGGGYGQAQLTHALGVGLWLTGLRGESVFALMKAALDAPVEHYDACAIRFRNGAIGSMSGAAAHDGAHDDRHQLRVRAMGSEGEFGIHFGRDHLWLDRADGFTARPELEPGEFLYDCDGPPHALVDLALGKEVENCSPAELGARTVEILDAAYRSAASGRLEPVRAD